jgi:hypothetical protein
MTASSVAAASDVSATPGTIPPSGESGTWSAGDISVTPHPHLVVGADPAISSASCEFTFSGGGSETLTLNATATVLHCDDVSVLVDGDHVISTQTGNQLTVSSTRTLKTS